MMKLGFRVASGSLEMIKFGFRVASGSGLIGSGSRVIGYPGMLYYLHQQLEVQPKSRKCTLKVGNISTVKFLFSAPISINAHPDLTFKVRKYS